VRLAKRVVVTIGVLVISCGRAVPPTKDSILKEVYYYSMALAPDTTTFATFAASAAAHTATWSTMRTTSRGMRALFSATLGQLGYGTGPFTWEYGSREQVALSRFQRDLGVPITGRLDSITVGHLVRADKALKMTDIKVPRLFVSRVESMFFASGTWKAITNKLGYPVNTVDIVCDVGSRECIVTTVNFISEELDQVHLDRTYLTVATWNDDFLVARSEEAEGGITMTINVPAQDVLWSQVNPARTFLGKAIGPEQMTLRLVNGMMLSPPFDGGDLEDVHAALFKDKKRYLALLKRNTVFEEARR